MIDPFAGYNAAVRDSLRGSSSQSMSNSWMSDASKTGSTCVSLTRRSLTFGYEQPELTCHDDNKPSRCQSDREIATRTNGADHPSNGSPQRERIVLGDDLG